MRVLLATDGSKDALGALRFVAGFVRGRAATLHLLAVVEPPRYPASAPGFLRDELTAVRKQLVAEQRAAGADLVVVGARGVGPVKRLLLGSVSEAVLRAARCAVLIVKRPRKA